MSAHLESDGGFGLCACHLALTPSASPDDILSDALCLIGNALAVFEAQSEAAGASGLNFAGLYLLRQGYAMLEAGQLASIDAQAIKAVNRAGTPWHRPAGGAV